MNRKLWAAFAQTPFRRKHGATHRATSRTPRTIAVSMAAAIAVCTVGMSIAAAGEGPRVRLPKGDCAAPKPKTDLRHCDFSGTDFHGANLSGASLTKARFIGARLEGALLKNVRLREKNFLGATGVRLMQ